MTLMATETTIKDFNTSSSIGSSLFNAINMNETNTQNDKNPSPLPLAKKPKARPPTPSKRKSPATAPRVSQSQLHASSPKNGKGCGTTKNVLKELEASNFISEQVQRLHPKDVLFGRGNGVAKFSGNSNFRALIFKFKPKYNASDRKDKQDVARLLMNEIFDAGGRFLEHLQHQLGPKKDNQGFVKDTFWTVSNQRALEKTCQALREKKGSYCPSHLIEKTTPKMTKKKTKREEASIKTIETRSTGNGNAKKSTPSNSRTYEAITLSASVDQLNHSDLLSSSPEMKCNRIMDKGKYQAGLEEPIVKNTLTGPAKQKRRLSSENNECSRICASPGRRTKKMKKEDLQKFVKKENHSNANCSSENNDAKKKKTIKVKGAKKHERSNYCNSSSASIETSNLSKFSQPTGSCTYSHAATAVPPVPETDDAAAVQHGTGNITASVALSALKVPDTNDILNMVPPEFEKFYSGALLSHCEDMLNRHGHVKPAARLNQKRLPSFSTPGKILSKNAVASLPNDDNMAGLPWRQHPFVWNEAQDLNAVGNSKNTYNTADLAADGKDHLPAITSNASIPCMARTHETEMISWDGTSSKSQAHHPNQCLPFLDSHCNDDCSMPNPLTSPVESFFFSGDIFSSSFMAPTNRMKRAFSWVSFKNTDEDPVKDNEDFVQLSFGGEVASLLPTTEDEPSSMCPTVLNYFLSGIHSIQEEADHAGETQLGKTKTLPEPVTPDCYSGLQNQEREFKWNEGRKESSAINDSKLAQLPSFCDDSPLDSLGHIDHDMWLPFASAWCENNTARNSSKRSNITDSDVRSGIATNCDLAFAVPAPKQSQRKYSLIDDDDDDDDDDGRNLGYQGNLVERWRQAACV